SFQIQNPLFKGYEGEEPVSSAIKVLKAGGIVAIKGLGGFHIACDAENRDAVALLRERKQRINKPFAMMAPDMDTIKGFCHVTDEEARLMLSRRRPVVLMKKRPDCRLPEEVAPKNRCLGFMLPYTPLHHLLFFCPEREGGGTPNFRCLVMTSGNLSGEPIIHENEAAIEGLAGVADAFLLHNRDIFMRVDDSVIRSNVFIRRSRGYVPEAIAVKGTGPEVLGVGADLKNTFTLTRDAHAIPSQHIGDMGSFETLKFFEETLENLKSLYRINPVAIAFDMHPGYYSTRWAETQPLEGLRVQHHHAHVASVMAEAGLKSEVIGVTLDGSGYGTDGNIWGSEFLIADLEGFKRLGHFSYMKLPGGEMAIREPWRIALGWLQEVTGGDALQYIDRVGFLNRYGEERIKNVLRLVELPEFTPYSSGAGRLFDAVAAIIGITDTNTYEAEAATALESCAAEGIAEDYPVDIRFADPMVVDFSFTLLRILEDMTSGTGRSIISARFHNTIVTVIMRVVNKLHSLTGIRDVVISGGVFQNIYITERVLEGLKGDGFRVYCNRRMPPNDANISLGQAYILRERLRQ
ncbi:[NiFe] hydrogenase metallocenter assembly protein HypF, partial [hydrothermal vent metagenome]